jgi:hypothetical protein
MCRFLDPFVAEINLHVSDPDFEIDKLPSGAVGSVTLTLPDRDPVVRMADARRFLLSRELFKKKRVWPGVAGVLNHGELDACLGLKMPFMSGPAITPIGLAPFAAKSVSVDRLPLG